MYGRRVGRPLLPSGTSPASGNPRNAPLYSRGRLRVLDLPGGRLCRLSSCADHRGGIDRALRVPSADIIAQRAIHLHHPMLRPITLDPRQPLSPQEAAVLAVLVNPNLTALRDRIGVSSAQLAYFAQGRPAFHGKAVHGFTPCRSSAREAGRSGLCLIDELRSMARRLPTGPRAGSVKPLRAGRWITGREAPHRSVFGVSGPSVTPVRSFD